MLKEITTTELVVKGTKVGVVRIGNINYISGFPTPLDSNSNIVALSNSTLLNVFLNTTGIIAKASTSGATTQDSMMISGVYFCANS